MRTSRILAALDYDRDNSAILQRVSRLAKATQTSSGSEPQQSTVLLFIADYSDALERSYPFDKQALSDARSGFLKSRRKWLEHKAQALRDEGIEVEVEANWAKPRYVSILEVAEAWGADLILKTTYPHSTLRRALLAPGDWHLIRKSAVPLWLVRDFTWGTHLGLAACVDPSPQGQTSRDERILETAHDLAISLPAEFHVIHAYEPAATGLISEFDAVMENSDSVIHEVRTQQKAAIDRLLEGRVEPGTRLHLEAGRAVNLIPAIAEREALDLVVLGAIARSTLERILIGSTAEQVLDEITADLLVVR